MRRTAVVTGGSKGIGLAITERLAADGYAVLTCARTRGAADQTAATLRAAGHDVIGLDADVSDPGDAERVVAAALERTGRLDVLVNNAGVYSQRPFLDLPLDEWRHVLDVNLTGAFACAQAAARAMRANEPVGGVRGHIVNIGSSCGTIAEPGASHYNVSKAGIAMLTQSIAVELAADGILCNCVAPGWVATEIDAEYLRGLTPERSALLNPMHRAAEPREIAHVVAVTCDPRNSFTTGATIRVDGGQTAVALRL